MAIATENLPDDIAALKQIIADMARDAMVAQTEIAKLKFQLALYRRAEFGRSSEKLARDIAQLELAIETVETDQVERLAAKPPGRRWSPRRPKRKDRHVGPCPSICPAKR